MSTTKVYIALGYDNINSIYHVSLRSSMEEYNDEYYTFTSMIDVNNKIAELKSTLDFVDVLPFHYVGVCDYSGSWYLNNKNDKYLIYCTPYWVGEPKIVFDFIYDGGDPIEELSFVVDLNNDDKISFVDIIKNNEDKLKKYL